MNAATTFVRFPDQATSDLAFFKHFGELTQSAEAGIQTAYHDLEILLKRHYFLRLFLGRDRNLNSKMASFLMRWTNKKTHQQLVNIKLQIDNGTQEKLEVYQQLCETWHYYPPDWLQRRERVLARDQHRCRGWGCVRHKGNLRVHHILPLSKGGVNNLENLVSLCRRCHQFQHPDNPKLRSPEDAFVDKVGRNSFLNYIQYRNRVVRGEK